MRTDALHPRSPKGSRAAPRYRDKHVKGAFEVMKFTEISDYPLDGGIATEWIPTAVVSPSQWQVDTRPLSYEHEAILRQPGSPARPSWLGAVFTIAHRYDPEVFDVAIRAWLCRHEAFHTIGDRTAYGEPAAGGVIRRTYREARLGLRRHVVGHVPDGTELARRLTNMFDASLSAHSWPHVRVVSISPLSSVDSDDQFTVVFAADHLVMDAYSIMLSINEIQQFYRGMLLDEEVEVNPVGSHIEFSSIDRETGGAVTPDHPTVAAWDGFSDLPPLLPHDRLPTEIGRPHQTNDGGRQIGYSEYIADGDQARALNTHARAVGVSTQAAVFAAIALACQGVTGDHHTRLVMPWHTRHESRFLTSVGWYVGLAPLHIELGSAATFVDACSAAASGLGVARVHSRVPYRRVTELLGACSAPAFVVSYLDLRRVPGASEWPARRAQALRSEAYSDREVYLWIGRVDDGLTLSARYPATDSAGLVGEFIDLVGETLRVAAAEGFEMSLDQYIARERVPIETTRTA